MELGCIQYTVIGVYHTVVRLDRLSPSPALRLPYRTRVNLKNNPFSYWCSSAQMNEILVMKTFVPRAENQL